MLYCIFYRAFYVSIGLPCHIQGHVMTFGPAALGAPAIESCMLLTKEIGFRDSCHALQVPAYGHVVCGGCSIMLMFPQGAQSVKCSVCHYVSPVNASTIAEAAGAGQRPGAKPNATVVIENPPTIDDKGNEVSTHTCRCNVVRCSRHAWQEYQTVCHECRPATWLAYFYFCYK